MRAWLRRLLRRMAHNLDALPLVGSYAAPPEPEDWDG